MLKEPENTSDDGRRTHRTYSREFKAEMVAACLQPGASVAALALSHGMNANVVHRWLKEHARAGRHQLGKPDASSAIATKAHVAALEFVQLPMPASAPKPECRGIEVELRKGALSLRVTWPASLAADFASWTAALLR